MGFKIPCRAASLPGSESVPVLQVTPTRGHLARPAQALTAGQVALLCGHSPCLVWALTPALGSWTTYTLTLPLSAGAGGYFAMSQRIVLAELFAKGGERGNNICIFKQIP